MPPTLTSWLQFFCVCNCPWSPWKTRVSVQPSLLPGAGSSTQAHVPLPHSKPFAHQLMDRRPNLVLVRFFSTLNAGKPHAVTPQWKSLEIECQKILPYTRRCSPRVHHCYVSYLLFPEGCNEIKKWRWLISCLIHIHLATWQRHENKGPCWRARCGESACVSTTKLSSAGESRVISYPSFGASSSSSRSSGCTSLWNSTSTSFAGKLVKGGRAKFCKVWCLQIASVSIHWQNSCFKYFDNTWSHLTPTLCTHKSPTPSPSPALLLSSPWE